MKPKYLHIHWLQNKQYLAFGLEHNNLHYWDKRSAIHTQDFQKFLHFLWSWIMYLLTTKK